MSPIDRSLFYRRAALAPICLCLVAGLQVARVWTVNQTPWKGGGFGMFSTVDDESARFVRCYLVTEDGDIPLAVPPVADKFVAELQAAPTQARLNELARRLGGQSWRWRDERQQREAKAIAACKGSKVTSAVFQPPEFFARGASDPAESNAGREHVLEPISLDEPAHDAIPFKCVRVECLRYRYAAADQTLRAEVMLSARVDRSAGEQGAKP